MGMHKRDTVLDRGASKVKSEGSTQEWLSTSQIIEHNVSEKLSKV